MSASYMVTNGSSTTFPVEFRKGRRSVLSELMEQVRRRFFGSLRERRSRIRDRWFAKMVRRLPIWLSCTNSRRRRRYFPMWYPVLHRWRAAGAELMPEKRTLWSMRQEVCWIPLVSWSMMLKWVRYQEGRRSVRHWREHCFCRRIFWFWTSQPTIWMRIWSGGWSSIWEDTAERWLPLPMIVISWTRWQTGFWRSAVVRFTAMMRTIRNFWN